MQRRLSLVLFTYWAVAYALVSAAEPNGMSTNWEKLTMQPFYDAQGTLTATLPFPSSWQVMRNRQPGEPTIVGPNGIKITDIPGQNFLYTNNPQMQQAYYQSGQPLRQMPGIERLIQEDAVPWAAQQGLTFQRWYEVPEVSRIDKWYNEQLYKAVPSQTEVVAIGTDWVHKNGSPFFMIIHVVMNTSDALQTWYYSANGLQAEPAHFDKAKKQLIFGIANARYNMQQIMAFNQSEAEKAGRSWAAHNQRMAQNQAAFDASQRDFVNRSNATNDAIMSGWRERNASSDRAHEQFIDTITERTNVVNPNTGTQYKVDSGANHYWMNSDGQYISVDSSSYDPNRDETLNNESWQKLEERK